MSHDLQRADERYRIRWLAVLTLVAVIGGIGILFLDDYLTGLPLLVAEAQPGGAAKARLIIRAILALIGLGGTGFGLYLGWISWRTLSSDRYPPPGTKVFSDTRIHRGLEARRRGQVALILAALTLLLTLAVVARANRVFDRLLDVTLKPTRVEIGALEKPSLSA